MQWVAGTGNEIHTDEYELVINRSVKSWDIRATELEIQLWETRSKFSDIDSRDLDFLRVLLLIVSDKIQRQGHKGHNN